MNEPLWLTEADVVAVLDMGSSIAALQSVLRLETDQQAINMPKTIASWGHGDSLHALGAAVPGVGLVGTKTWAHTEGGATPLLILWNSEDGSLAAIVESFALGQLRTAGVSAVATDLLARTDATDMAIVGTGKQALPQVAAVAAVRDLRRVSVFSPTAAKRQAFVAKLRDQFPFAVVDCEDLETALRDAAIITLATRATEPFLRADGPARGAHINALGAIVPTRIEFEPELLARCTVVAADSPEQTRALSQEFRAAFDPAGWDAVTPLSRLIADDRRRPPDADLTLFKAMGMGLADLALGQHVLTRARERGLGRGVDAAATRADFLFTACNRLGVCMPDAPSPFVDVSGARSAELDLWPSIVINKNQIDAEVARLAGITRPANGVRRSLIVHPRSTSPGLGLAPGIRVALDVLLPGETTKPVRHNSTLVNFCIRGAGSTLVSGKRMRYALHDVWNTPSMAPYVYVNDTAELQVRLQYSNAALLERLNVHVVDDTVTEDDSELLGHGAAAQSGVSAAASGPAETKAVNPFGTFELADGAWLMPYEKLINPDVVTTYPLQWQWDSVKTHLDRLEALGQKYRGRRLYLLFNPATGRTNGTTDNLFATMCLRPPKIVDRPHRHTAAAINYYFAGSGYSIVQGQRFDWKAGDLMLSAPGWAVHNHASKDEAVYELTIQDSPINIAMGSLLWQENLAQPFAVLGAESGFETNRELVGAAL